MPRPSRPPRPATPEPPPPDPPCPGGQPPWFKHYWTVVVRGPWECQRCGFRKDPPGSTGVPFNNGGRLPSVSVMM